MTYIISLGLFQCLLAVALLWLGSRRKVADYLLIWLLISIATHLAIKLVIFTTPSNEAVKQGLNTFIHLAYGPILWMYAKKVQNERYLPYKHWYLFIPTLLAAVCYLSIIISTIATGVVPVDFLSMYNEVMSLLFIPIVGGFSIMALRIARKLPPFWRAEAVLIKRIAIIFILCSIIVSSSQFIVLGFINPGPNFGVFLRIVVYSLLLVASLLVVQYKVRIWQLLSEGSHQSIAIAENDKNWESSSLMDIPMKSIDAEAVAEKGQELGYSVEKKSVLSSEQQDNVLEKINRGMEKHKWYADPEFSLDKLSKEAKIPKHHISESLNQRAGISFSQWINERRIDHFCKALEKCHDLAVNPNILILAYEAGFNSKSSFNHSFKKFCGLTPSAYWESLRNKRIPDGFISKKKDPFFTSSI